MSGNLSNRPLTMQEMQALRGRINALQGQMNSGMPTNIGEGIARLGQGLALGAARSQYNAQFPDAPAAPGSQPPTQPAYQKIADAMLNRSAGLFPDAPPPAQNQFPAPPQGANQAQFQGGFDNRQAMNPDFSQGAGQGLGVLSALFNRNRGGGLY